MLTRLTSKRPLKDSQDLLNHQSEQIIFSIAKFLDLKSLENFQLTNRRMRELFLLSVWKNLLIVTFLIPNPPLSSFNSHELFRRKYFEKNPQELWQYEHTIRAFAREEREVRREQEDELMYAREYSVDYQRTEINFVGWSLPVFWLMTLCEWAGFSYDGDCSSKCYDLAQRTWNQTVASPIILLIYFIYLLCYKAVYGDSGIRETRQEIGKQAWKILVKTISLLVTLIMNIRAFFILGYSSCYDEKSNACIKTVGFGQIGYGFNSICFLLCFILCCTVLSKEFKLRWTTPVSRPLLAFEY